MVAEAAVVVEVAAAEAAVVAAAVVAAEEPTAASADQPLRCGRCTESRKSSECPDSPGHQQRNNGSRGQTSDAL